MILSQLSCHLPLNILSTYPGLISLPLLDTFGLQMHSMDNLSFPDQPTNQDGIVPSFPLQYWLSLQHLYKFTDYSRNIHQLTMNFPKLI